MRVLYLLILVFLPATLLAQFSISGEIIEGDKKLKRVILYQIVGGKQVYIKNQNLKEGTFNLSLDSDTSPGTYRVVYDYANSGYVDVLFNKENIHFKVDAARPDVSLYFTESKENIVFQNYLNEMFSGQHLLDSVQMVYFNSSTPATAQTYKEFYFGLRDLQLSYEQETANMLVHDFIHASQRYNSPMALALPHDYLAAIKSNFFKYINFDSESLKNSSFFVDRSYDYVFNLNYSKDPKVQENLYKEAVDNLFALPKNSKLQRDLIQVLIDEFLAIESYEMVKYLLDQHYKKLPTTLQDPSYITTTIAKITLLPGAKAPNFSLDETTDLYSLDSHEKYLLVFWSTSCGHCKDELPKLKQFLGENSTVKVISIALENKKEAWEVFIRNYSDWKHVLALGKWENPIAVSYAIEATPTFVLLDKDKKIIALPEGLEVLEKIITEY